MRICLKWLPKHIKILIWYTLPAGWQNGEGRCDIGYLRRAFGRCDGTEPQIRQKNLDWIKYLTIKRHHVMNVHVQPRYVESMYMCVLHRHGNGLQGPQRRCKHLVERLIHVQINSINVKPVHCALSFVRRRDSSSRACQPQVAGGSQGRQGRQCQNVRTLLPQNMLKQRKF